MGAAEPDEQEVFDAVAATHNELDDADARGRALERPDNLRSAKPRGPASPPTVGPPLAPVRELDDDPVPIESDWTFPSKELAEEQVNYMLDSAALRIAEG